MERKEFLSKLESKISDADMLLIGIGEEFECRKELLQNQQYAKIYQEIKDNKYEWIFPYLNFYFMKKEKPEVLEGLRKLAEIIKDKDYFLISTCCNDIALNKGFYKDKIVSPCGGFRNMQFLSLENKEVFETDKKLLKKLDTYFEGETQIKELNFGDIYEKDFMAFNSILLEDYNEEGYLTDWENYTKWIQSTLNKKLCVLELGVGMNYPSVIRWPFEKIAFFNQKASFFRVHKNLYQVSKELHDKGYGLGENACSFICLLS